MRLDYDATKREFVGAVRFAEGDREVRIPLAEIEEAMLAVPKIWFHKSAIEQAAQDRDLLRLRSLDEYARVCEGVEELTVEVLIRWLTERRDFAVALARRA